MLPFRAYQFFIFFLALSALMKVLIKRCTIIKNPFHVSISFESKKAPQNGRSIPFFVCDNCTFSTWHFCNSYDMLYFQQKICNQALSNGEDGLACNGRKRKKGSLISLVISLEISKVQNIEPFLYNFSRITFKNFRCVYAGVIVWKRLFTENWSMF